MDIPLLVGGLAVLVLSGEVLVRNAAGLAIKASIPPVIVGLTIVSLGTSAPEIFASVRAALEGNPGLAVGNVIGSNIANLALILGVTALIHPVAVDRSLLRSDWPVMMAATLAFIGLGWDLEFSATDGLVLLLGVALLLLFFYRRSVAARKTEVPDDDGEEFDAFAHRSYAALAALIVAGTIGLNYGAEWFIAGARGIAAAAGVSDHIIGVTVVAFGTSVPELVASGAAAMKGESDLALGNLVGSNIFNILLALGLTATIHPVDVEAEAIAYDAMWMLGVAAILLPMMLHKRLIHRWKGGVMLAIYLLYVGLIVQATWM
jgi:cation:H+ antiporter